MLSPITGAATPRWPAMPHRWRVVSLRAVWPGWIAAIHKMLLVPFLGHRGTAAILRVLDALGTTKHSDYGLGVPPRASRSQNAARC